MLLVMFMQHRLLKYDHRCKHCESAVVVIWSVQVKAILVNVFGGIVNCATIANGIVNAAKSIKMNVPVVVRLEGRLQIILNFFHYTLVAIFLSLRRW